FTVPNAQLVVDYGASAAANRFGMAGWTRVIMDAYVGYMSNGPAGIYTEGSGGYDFRGVIGTPRLFKAGETISATWYNMQSYPITFTPKVSLRDSSRPANTNNGWRTMSTITIPPDRSLESIYTIDTASAGTYQVVNVSSNYTPPGYPDRLMLCDRIEYFTIDSGTTSIDHISGDGETGSELTVSPNPFNPSVNIRLSGVSVRPLQFRIYNLSGHCIAQLTSATNQGAVVWNADSEPSGIYLVVARSAGKTFSRKIILSK
ncbi:MAG: T9SS type A sorting domain-containing protein, partial [Fibrobacteres bacterium]|nr:T9SS type A sorting domain-containing protein [Fibrobacterota bacterium]